MQRMRWYVGSLRDETGTYVPFKHWGVPTQEVFGKHFRYVIGPFPAKQHAMFMVLYGMFNPHMQSVSDVVKVVKSAKAEWKREAKVLEKRRFGTHGLKLIQSEVDRLVNK